MNDKDWEEMDAQTVAIVRLCLLMNVGSLFENETTTIGLMNVVTNRYEKYCANNKVYFGCVALNL